MLDVTLIKMGTANREFSFETNEDATIKHLLERAEEKFVEGCVTVGQSPASLDKILTDGMRVFIAEPTKGNVPWDVTIIRFGNGANVTLPVEDGITINQLLDQLPSEQRSEFFKENGDPIYEYRLATGGGSIPGSTELTRPDDDGNMRLIFSEKTKGNL